MTLQYPFAEDYPAKGNRTLVDGNRGYTDFSYNWLCFYGVPMVATVDLGSAKEVKVVSVDFLDDPRHWIFKPESVNVEVSVDGVKYTSIGVIKAAAREEHYDITVDKHAVPNDTHKQVRYIRVTATNLSSFPEWRYSETKKPMIACDEIYVE